MSISTLFSNPKVTRPLDVVPVTAFGDTMWQILSAEETGNVVEVAVCQTSPGNGPPLHVHTLEDEIFRIDEGSFEFNIGGKRIEAGPGTIVFAPRYVPHNFRCISETDGQMTIIFTPGNFNTFFRRCAGEFEAGVPDFDRIVTISAEHGISYLQANETEEYMASHPAVEPKVIYPGSGERLTVPGGAFRFLIDSEESDYNFGMLELETPVNAGPPLHIHNSEDELFIILDGRYEFQLDNETVEVGAGDIVWAPRPFAHAFKATGSAPAKMLTVLMPGGFENYFRRLHRELNARGFSRELMLELHAEYGLENPVR